MTKICSAGKMRLAVAFAIGMVLCGLETLAEDLTVARGETLVLPSSASYDTVSVSGTLNIPAGLTLTATTLELGPNEGDDAVVNILGSNNAHLEVANAVYVGRSGGAGKIVALSEDAVHNTGWDGMYLVKMTDVYICPRAAASADGYIDFLKLGPGTVAFTNMVNESHLPTRILVNNGCIGYSQEWGGAMFDSGDFRIEAFDGGNIRIGSGYCPRYINSTSSRLVFDGNGADVVFCRYAGEESQFYILNEGIEWVDVRDVCTSERHPVKLVADNLLPYGPGTGGFVMHNSENSEKCILLIENTTQHLNYFSSPLTLDKESLKGTEGAKVIFGEGDQDGFLKGRIGANVGVFKVGTGIFSITNAAEVGTFTVSGGTLRIAADFRLEKLVVDAGATLVIDGVTVEPYSGSAEVKGELVLLNGGRLKTFTSVENDERVAGWCTPGEWTKLGAANLVLEDPVCMPSDIHVKEGTVSFAAEGYACELFRLNVTAWNNVDWRDGAHGALSNMFYLAELAFVDPAGNRIGALNMAQAPIGTAPGALSSGTAAFASGTELMTAGGSGDAYRLFDAHHWPRVGVASPLTTDEGGVTLFVRLPAGSQAVSAINFAGAYGGLPRSWTLSGSIDGGNSWHILNEMSGYDASNDSAWTKWLGGTGEDIASFTVPKAFPLVCANPEFAPSGVRNMPEAVQVEVDAGAVLDFTNVAGAQTVDAVTLDAAAGGGTVRNARFAEAGTIFLAGVPDGASIEGLSVPMLLENCLSVNNLRRWSICADGVMQPSGRYHAVYRNGRVVILGSGFVLTVR